MAGSRVLLDTGPLVALIHRDDAHHHRCQEVLRSFRGLLLTTEAVLTEATHLLSRVRGGTQACLEFFVRAGAILVPMTRTTLRQCQVLMLRYEDLPMDFADATLVALAEEASVREVFTLDRRDFGVYRVGKRQTFRIRPE